MELVQVIKELKYEVICPVCLDMIQQAIEFCCGHKLCSDCYFKCKSRKLVCPICKVVMKRRSALYKDDYVNNLGRFMMTVCEQFEVLQHCQILSNEKERNQKEVPEETQPSTSRNKRKIPIETPSTSQEDPFDKLLRIQLTQNSLRVNKGGKKRTYSKRKEGKKSDDGNFKLLDFENDKNKQLVVQWLHDTRNMFDRLTQTQNVIDKNDQFDGIMVPENLPSVSQRKTLDVLLNTVNLSRKGRSKSVDLIQKKPVRKKNSVCCSEIIENYNIEDMNTEEEKIVEKAEENVLLNLIEDEFLDKLETELEAPVNSDRQCTTSESSSKLNLNSLSATGWGRISVMQRSLKKNLKEPKQLKIVLKSLQPTNAKMVKDSSSRIAPVADEVHAEEDNVDKYTLKARKSSENNVMEANKENHFDDNNGGDIKIVPSVNNKQDKTKTVNLHKCSDNIINHLLEDTNDNQDLDPFTVPTQKNSSSRNNSNLENEEKNDSANIERPFGRLTQKLNLNLSKSSEENAETNVEDENITYTDLVQLLGNNIYDFVRIIQNNSVQEIREKLKFVLTHTELIKNITKTELGTVAVPVQTDRNVVDRLVQTSTFETCDISVQTDFEIIDRGVQTTLTENSYSKNSQQFSKKNMKNERPNPVIGITQETRKALESFLSEPEIVASNTLAEIQNKMPKTNASTVLKLKTQNDVFSAGFDNLSFDTQDLAEQLVNRKTSVKKSQGIADEKLKDLLPKSSSSENISPQSSKESKLVCTINSDQNRKVNRKLQYNATGRSSKRNRISSDSDSDVDIKPSRKRNRFIDSDLSVEFETNGKTFETQKGDHLTPDSDNVNYEERLNEILKKYDHFGATSNTVKSRESKGPNREKSPENLLTHCDDIIAEVNRNVEVLTKLKSFKDTNEKASTSRMDEHNNNVNDENSFIGKLLEKSQSQISDVIGETESLGVLSKRFRLDAAFSKGKTSTKSKRLVKKNSEKNIDICGELNDSFDEAELEQIALVEENMVVPKVNVLANVVVKNKRDDEKSSNEDDLFSDDDVVETTQQKRMNVSGLWLPESDVTCISNKEDVDLSQQIEDFEFDVALPPPPAFQDDVEVCDEREQANRSNQRNVSQHALSRPRVNFLSLTPNDLSQYIKKDSPKKSNLNQSFNKEIHQTPERRNRLSHSTPRPSYKTSNVETLGFSPIKSECNIRDTAKASKANTLISMSRENSPRHNIMTNTPGQKSIWNYVKASQNNKNEHSSSKLPKTKPCIACTRLSSTQVMLITEMSNKKLATYSTVFNADVTHMIVTVDERHCLVDYTVKFMAAVAAGIWVVRFEWVQECLANNCIVPEESFEVFDDSGGRGPRMARLMRNTNPLLKNFKFYCPDLFVSTTRQEIEGIIKHLGGKIVSNLDQLQEADGRFGLILTEGRTTQDFDMYEKWLEKYKVATVDIEWLSKSIGRYKILSIRPYMWCTDDNLGEFDYPDYLIENVAFSDSEPN